MRTLPALIASLPLLATVVAPSAGPGSADSASLVEVRGARLYVQTFGNGAPMVFLHGGLHHFDVTFARQRDEFARSRRVIGIDQRGHGHSPDTDEPFSYRDMAEDIAALIVRLGIAPADIVGHSDGGNVALLLARSHPQLVRRIAVSGANMRAGFSDEELARRRAMSAQQVADRLPARFRDDYARVSPDGAAHWPVFAAKSWRLWLTPVVIGTDGLAAIEAPALVIAGDRDLAPIEETVALFRALKRGQLLILPATGHDTFNDRPDAVNAALHAFFEQPDKPALP